MWIDVQIYLHRYIHIQKKQKREKGTYTIDKEGVESVESKGKRMSMKKKKKEQKQRKGTHTHTHTHNNNSHTERLCSLCFLSVSFFLSFAPPYV